MDNFDLENLNDWIPLSEVSENFPQFSKSQIKTLFWRRHKHQGLATCYRKIGKKGYVNIRRFAIWMGGGLSE